MPSFRSIYAITALCLAAVGVSGWAQPEPSSPPQCQGKPAHEEARLRHIKRAEDKLIRYRELLDALHAEVEIYSYGQDSPRYAVKAEDMPRLRYIVSQLQANPEFVPMRVSMRHSRRLHCLNLDFGEGVKLSLRVEYITNPGRSDTSHKRSLYALPNEELRRELIGIIEHALLPKK